MGNRRPRRLLPGDPGVDTFNEPEMAVEPAIFETTGTTTHHFLPGARAETRFDASHAFAAEAGMTTSGRMVGTVRSTWRVEGDLLPPGGRGLQ